jgi:outer membrane lipoprotein-sorting protein
MKKYSVLLFGLVLALLSSGSAFADTIFNFSFAPNSGGNDSNKFSGSGTFTTTDLTGGKYLITDVTGTVSEGSNVGDGTIVSIVSILSAGTFGGNDNFLFYPSSTNSNKSFDNSGVAFILSDGSSVRLYNNNNENLLESVANGHSSFSEGGDIRITPVDGHAPEPGTLMLFGTGALGLAGTIRRKLYA